ncbi:MAG TPA: hypothetical protein VK550_29610 [Polyangiaceae bacterium]|nr:hypothetical protein [Polyangiaceae bacterium]
MLDIRPKVHFTVAAFLALAGAACGSGSCPTASSPSQSSQWEQELDARPVLPLDPSGGITIKRDVHNIVIGASAAGVADAFHRVMRDKNRRFGLIRVDRKRANVDQAFAFHERFQGRYELDEALQAKIKAGWLKKMFADAIESQEVQCSIRRIENQLTSDYGRISRLELTPPEGGDFVLAYEYLTGSPIAGSTTFIVTPLGKGQARLTQIFVYQEQSASFVSFFGAGGLKLHDQVVLSQATQAAELLGAKIIESDIPPEYANP